jgi:GNAT superfamily N-acetyltransferase
MTGNDIIRSARAADAPAIARLMRSSKAEAMPWLAVTHTLEEDDGWVAGVLLPADDVRVAVSSADPDVLVGVLALSPGWVNHLYIATSEQGRGVGSRMLRLAQETTTEDLQLWAFQRNTRARTFYEARGFVDMDRTDGDNEEREPDVLYRWSIDRA